MIQVLFVTGNNVLLPGSDLPQPATLKIDVGSGRITDIQHKHVIGSNFASDLSIKWIDAGDKYILPGLVESVNLLFAHYFFLYPKGFAVRTSTLTNLAVQTGKAFGQELGQLSQEVSPHLLICP